MPDSDLETFVTGYAYRSVVLVLAIQVGSPRVASSFLEGLMSGVDRQTVRTTVRSLDDQRLPARSVGPAEQLEWSSLVERIGLLADDLDPAIADLRPWITRLRRFTVEGALTPTAQSTSVGSEGTVALPDRGTGPSSGGP